ncbi:MAG: transposase [Bacteroidetes bacterium]|nr:MAG: transposase [Bacteroidota bacterium]
MNKIPLEPDKYYHIYNHANGSDNLFVEKDNYRYFIEKYKRHISPIADTFSYCLMPNHFHFAIRIKCNEKLFEHYNLKASKKHSRNLLTKNDWSSDYAEQFLSQQFSNLFTNYAQALNKQQGRRGSLFAPNFERKLIDSDEYLRNIILYIHSNPISHGFVDKVNQWKHSSYNSFIENSSSFIKVNEVIACFDDLANFIAIHQSEVEKSLDDEF